MSVASLPPSSLRDDVAEVRALAERAADGVRTGEAHDLTGSTSALLVAELVHAAGLLDAAGATLLRRADASGALRLAGFLTQKTYLTDGIGLGDPHAGALLALGRSLDRYPALGDGVLAGRVNVDAARTAAEGIDSAATDLRGPARDEARAKGEAIMLPLAEVGTVAQGQTAAAGLLFQLRPADRRPTGDGGLRAQRGAHRSRRHPSGGAHGARRRHRCCLPDPARREGRGDLPHRLAPRGAAADRRRGPG